MSFENEAGYGVVVAVKSDSHSAAVADSAA